MIEIYGVIRSSTPKIVLMYGKYKRKLWIAFILQLRIIGQYEWRICRPAAIQLKCKQS